MLPNSEKKTSVNTYGPFTQATIDRSKIGPISQQSLKSNEKAISVWHPCALIKLSAISPSGWTNLVFIERLLRSLSVRWAFIERSRPLAIIERLFWTDWKLWGDRGDHGGHWTIIERSWRSLGALWKIVERSGHFFHRSTVSQRSPPLCKGSFITHTKKPTKTPN